MESYVAVNLFLLLNSVHINYLTANVVVQKANDFIDSFCFFKDDESKTLKFVFFGIEASIAANHFAEAGKVLLNTYLGSACPKKTHQHQILRLGDDRILAAYF